MKYTIEELVNKVNSLFVSSDVTDGRVSNSISVRRVRDYQSKGMLSEPIKVGKHSYYDEDHVKQLVALRSLQSTGLSDSFLQKLSTSSPLYYKSSEIEEQISSNVGSSLYEGTTSNKMKENALAALNKCAVNSNADAQVNSTALAYKGISAASANSLSIAGKGLVGAQASVEGNKLNDKLNLENNIKERDFYNNFPIEFHVDAEKEKQHAKRYEDSLRKPHYSNMYYVHEKVSLEVKTPYSLTEEDKSKIIERLKDIINSL